MMLVLVLQGCAQTTSLQNNAATLNLSSNSAATAQDYAKANKEKALARQAEWNEKLVKLKADHEARLKKLSAGKSSKKLSDKPVKKATAKPTKKYSGKGRSRYNALIAKYARANGVPLKLAHAVVQVESTYRANARGRAGEIGLMQLRLSTARGIGYRGSAKALYNPETNLKYGMKYLGKAYKLGGGSTCGTILKYNAGHGAKRMNRISANYCRKVKRLI